MQRKTLSYAFMLCLVMLVSAACSPAAGPDQNRKFGVANYTPNNAYHNPSGFYDDDKGFKNDFVPADLNPNLVTGTNDLYNLDADAQIMAEIASMVQGVEDARVNLNGGTAHVNLDLEEGVDVAAVKATVYQRVQFKMPRYRVDVDVR